MKKEPAFPLSPRCLATAIVNVQGHPRVVRLYETYEDKHYVCLVMECCHGGDLHDAIAAR